MARISRNKTMRAEADRVERRYNSLMSWIALAALSVLPLIFRIAEIDFVAPDITNTTSADTDTITDVFTHVKMQVLYSLVAALTVIFCVKLFAAARTPLAAYTESTSRTPSPARTQTAAERMARPERMTRSEQGLDEMPWVFRLTRYDAAVGLLCVLLLVSCMASRYGAVAFSGFAYMLDGAAEHICYCAMFFFGFHVFSRYARRDRFVVPLYIVGITNALISLLNFLGVQMIDSRIIKAVMGIPAGMRAVDANAFTSTFGNVNYLSGFGGVLFSVFLARLLFSESPVTGDERRGKGWLAGHFTGGILARIAGRVDFRTLGRNAATLLMVAASFSIVVTSLSSSGFLTFVVMTPVILIFAALGGITRRKVALAVASLAICAAVFASLASVNPTVYEETTGMFKSLASAVYNTGDERDEPGVPEIKLVASQSDVPEIRLVASASGPQPLYAASAADSASDAQSGGHDSQSDNQSDAQSDGLTDVSSSQPSPLYAVSDLPLPTEFPESGIAPGTGRLYIWGETLKLIALRPLIGYGMDTLSYAFPQNDLNKAAGLGSSSIFVTKPHNVYIGYAYGAGIPAALVFIVLCVFGAAAFLRYFFSARASGESHDPLIVCAMLGWAAYMVQAFVNDDLIATAPLWWTLFGLGAGLIHQHLRFSRASKL